MLKYLIAVLFLIACDPGDDTWNGKAPGAPDCAPDDEECLGEDEPDSSADKHVGGTHRAYPAQVDGHRFDYCDVGYATCWWKNYEYNSISVFTNITPYGQPPKTWTVQRIWVGFCYGGLANSTVLAANSVQACTPGHCVDISNINISGPGGCRSGFVSLPLVIGPNNYSHVEVFVNMHDWWQPNPMTYATLSNVFIDYLD
jgi:hypothetical protein